MPISTLFNHSDLNEMARSTKQLGLYICIISIVKTYYITYNITYPNVIVTRNLFDLGVMEIELYRILNKLAGAYANFHVSELLFTFRFHILSGSPAYHLYLFVGVFVSIYRISRCHSPLSPYIS